MNHISIDKDMKMDQTGLQAYRFNETTIYIDGLIYAYGKKAGEETICWLFEILKNKNYIPFEELHGAYSCFIVEQDKLTAFTDNSNMHCIYYSDSILSNSFLEIVQNEINSGRQPCFDLESICEYLTLGNVYLEKTFFTNVRILHSAEIITVEKGKIINSRKPIGDIDKASNVNSFSDYFDKMAYSLSEMKVCQALTGGYDSRLVYSCLSNRIKIHPAISANDLENRDVKCAQKVAMVNQDNLEIVNIPKPDYSDEIILQLFKEKDGIVPFDLDSDIRLHTFLTKLAEKYDIHMSGDGGVLHKDWEWTQDLPFYHKRKSDANKFYFQRLYYLSNSKHIGNALKSILDGQLHRFTQNLDSISKSINTQSYDSWYYHISGNRRTCYNCNPIDGIISYAPLNEMDIVRYSYALPRWKRFFFNSMRETMTKENRKIARIQTNYGTNASNELSYIAVDLVYQFIEYLRKAFRLIGRKLAHINVLNRSVLDWSLEEEIRKSNIAHNAIEYAEQNGFVQKLSIESFSYSEIQRMIHIYCLFCFVSKREQ